MSIDAFMPPVGAVPESCLEFGDDRCINAYVLNALGAESVTVEHTESSHHGLYRIAAEWPDGIKSEIRVMYQPEFQNGVRVVRTDTRSAAAMMAVNDLRRQRLSSLALRRALGLLPL